MILNKKIMNVNYIQKDQSTTQHNNQLSERQPEPSVAMDAAPALSNYLIQTISNSYNQLTPSFGKQIKLLAAFKSLWERQIQGACNTELNPNTRDETGNTLLSLSVELTAQKKIDKDTPEQYENSHTIVELLMNIPNINPYKHQYAVDRNGQISCAMLQHIHTLAKEVGDQTLAEEIEKVLPMD